MFRESILTCLLLVGVSILMEYCESKWNFLLGVPISDPRFQGDSECKVCAGQLPLGAYPVSVFVLIRVVIAINILIAWPRIGKTETFDTDERIESGCNECVGRYDVMKGEV